MKKKSWKPNLLFTDLYRVNIYKETYITQCTRQGDARNLKGGKNTESAEQKKQGCRASLYPYSKPAERDTRKKNKGAEQTAIFSVGILYNYKIVFFSFSYILTLIIILCFLCTYSEKVEW